MKKLVVFLLAYPLFAIVALRLAAAITGAGGVVDYFTGAHPVRVVSSLAIGFSIGSYLLGAISGDYSWVDRLWSTAPVAFAWVYAVRSGLAVAAVVGALLVTLWGLRLTYNFARRGGYTTMEDYRWPILRARIRSSIGWQAFNLLFISGFQVSLFVLFTAPIHRLAALGEPVAPAIPVAGGLLVVAFLAFETIADNQQWTFQSIKHGSQTDGPARPPAWFGGSDEDADAALAADVRRGFLTHGLFAWSRHPNYFGELGVWWALFLTASVASGGLFHWSGIGVVLLTLLFAGSTRFTESISASRYADYAAYQARTSAIIPWPPAGITREDPGCSRRRSGGGCRAGWRS